MAYIQTPLSPLMRVQLSENLLWLSSPRVQAITLNPLGHSLCPGKDVLVHNSKEAGALFFCLSAGILVPIPPCKASFPLWPWNPRPLASDIGRFPGQLQLPCRLTTLGARSPLFSALELFLYFPASSAICLKVCLFYFIWQILSGEIIARGIFLNEISPALAPETEISLSSGTLCNASGFCETIDYFQRLVLL